MPDPMKDHCAATVMASPEVVAALAALNKKDASRGVQKADPRPATEGGGQR
jgi:hypothetical protein